MLKIYIVVVLYKKSCSESPTIQSLFSSLSEVKSPVFDYHLIIYDNSPVAHDCSNLAFSSFSYIWDGANHGLSSAYNFAFAEAVKNNAEWLLLLDHDTNLIPEYFISINELFQKEITANNDIVAVLPKVKDGPNLISPCKTGIGFTQKVIHEKKYGLIKGVTSINSGSLIKTDFLKEVNGFNASFKLDMLDHWLFNEIRLRNKIVYILNLFIQHNLSVRNFEEEITVDRYKSIVNSEKHFVLNYLNIVDRQFFLLRLIARTIKYALIYKDKQFAKITFASVFCKEELK